MANAKVTLVKSLIGAKQNQKATAASLGLRKIGDFAIHADNKGYFSPCKEGKRIIYTKNSV